MYTHNQVDTVLSVGALIQFLGRMIPFPGLRILSPVFKKCSGKSMRELTVSDRRARRHGNRSLKPECIGKQ